MTRQRRQELADYLLAEHTFHLDYIRGEVGMLSLLPIGYGILTWIFGEQLWAGSAVYRTALSMPGAPQSWGTLFIALGATLMVCGLRLRYRVVRVVAVGAALVLALFMVMFLTEYFTTGNASALPPALAWAVFSLLLLNMARHAVKMASLMARPAAALPEGD